MRGKLLVSVASECGAGLADSLRLQATSSLGNTRTRSVPHSLSGFRASTPCGSAAVLTVTTTRESLQAALAGVSRDVSPIVLMRLPQGRCAGWPRQSQGYRRATTTRKPEKRVRRLQTRNRSTVRTHSLQQRGCVRPGSPPQNHPTVRNRADTDYRVLLCFDYPRTREIVGSGVTPSPTSGNTTSDHAASPLPAGAIGETASTLDSRTVACPTAHPPSPDS